MVRCEPNRVPRVRLILLALAVSFASCTGGGAEPTTTTSSAAGPDAAHTQMVEALGGSQSVQDFIVHLDMSVPTDDDLISILDQVTERAREGAGDPVDLAGGFTMRPVDSLQAEMVDPEGHPLPTLSVDFALLKSTPEHTDQLRALLAGALGDGDDATAVLDAVFDSDGSDAGTLVEIVTASYGENLTHAGPGDSSALDLSFVTAPAGPTLLSVHLFGQTRPGDPDRERGLSPHELFAYRWNAGLVRLLGSENGVQMVATTATLEAGVSTSASGSGLPLAMVVGPFLGAQDDQSTGPVRRQTLKAFAKLRLTFGAYLAAGPMAETMLKQAWEKSRTSGTSTTVLFVKGLVPIPGTPAIVQAVPEHCISIYQGDGGNPQMSVGFRLTPPGAVPSDSDKCANRVPAHPINYQIWWRFSALEQACVGIENHLRRANEAADRAERRAAEEEWTRTTFVGPTTPLVGPTAPDSPDPLPPPPKPTPSCSPHQNYPRSAGAVGDVHLVTVDHLSYDNQAAGEFLIFENGAVTVQMRTEPWEDSQIASVVTAMAARVDGHEVSLHPGGLGRTGVTWIDGEQVDLPRGKTRALGDGAIVWTGTGWVVIWSDGTRLNVDERGNRLMFTVYPSDLPIDGMLGNGDDDRTNDLVTRDGTLVPDEIASDPPSFYATFIDSWRITADESLFHYESGESTAGFQVADFPDHTMIFEDQIDELAAQAAEVACRQGGVTRPELIAACVYDLVVTGDDSFVYDHYVLDHSLPNLPEPSASDAPTPDPVGEGANLLTVGDLAFAFDAAPGWCTYDDLSLGAAHTFTDASGRQIDLSVQYVDTADPSVAVRVIVRVDREDYAWLNTFLAPPSGSVTERTFGGGGLALSGLAFVNDPYDPTLIPTISPIPTDAELQPLVLQITCNP